MREDTYDNNKYIKTCDLNYIMDRLNELSEKSSPNFIGNFDYIKYFMILSENNISHIQENIESIVDNLITKGKVGKYIIPIIYSARNIYELLIKLVKNNIIDIVKLVNINGLNDEYMLWSDVFMYVYKLLLNVSLDNLFINLTNAIVNDFYGIIECDLYME